MRTRRHARILAAATLAALPVAAARAQNASAPAILQLYEASYKTMERRAPDIFMAGYGHIWTPPPGRAEQGNLSVGYDVYDRFDLGSAGNPTLYGTETGLRTTIGEMHKIGVNVYTDLVWNHNGFANQGSTGFAAAGGYPGFVLSNGGDADGDFHGAFEGGDQNGRLSGLIDIAQEKNYQYIRSPVPGFANNIPAGTTPAFGRLANVPTEANRRFYPDRNQAPILVFDPRTGESNIPIYPFNTSNPMAGDPVPENALGYLMRQARWMIQDVGVDGFRLDATKHMPPWVLDYYDRAVYRAIQTPLLDGSTKHVFGFGEYLDTNTGAVQQSIRKDINPANPGTIGGNRDALDFAMHYALKNNLGSNGLVNNWHNIVNTTQDVQDDGLANNGSQGVAFDASHDDGGAYLGNVANAYLLMRPGNAVVYMNAKEFGTGRSFPADGRGDALGGFHGETVKRLVDIRNTHGRGNYAERWIDQQTLVFEREKSALAGYNNRLDTGYDQRTVQTAFTPGVHLVELTGNATDGTVDPFNDILDTVVVNGTGQVTMRIPRNKTGTVEHGKGYVIYGLQNPKGSVSLSNVARTIAGETPTAATNGTARLTAIDIVKANSFNFTLNTTAVTLSDGWRDFDADGNNALLRVDGGSNINGNANVDNRAPGTVEYGFEDFVTQRNPGYASATGNGTYVQSIDTTQLSEGYHYMTARAFRRRVDGGQPIYTDFRKVVYVDRFRPQSVIAELKPFGTDDRDVIVQSTDKTATGVHVFHNLGASQYTDAQLTSMAGGGSNAAGTYDRDLFKYGLLDMKNGNHAITVVTFELSYDPALGFAGGGVNVQRFAGIGFTAGGGLGVADLNFNNAYELGDVNLFQTVLESNNTAYNPGGDLNADGLIDETDNVLNVPWLVSRSASAGTINSATQLRLTRAMALDGTMNIPSGTLNVSGVSIPATPLTFTNSFNILAGKTITKTGGQALNISAPQSHGNKAKLEVAGGVVNMNTNGGTNLTVNTAGA
ncbi:MAG: hypothetical protein QOF78_2145, partial [Phycisphaerales bacterium]|nr:hypothetical protein [Phycisphaerales bacterium]